MQRKVEAGRARIAAAQGELDEQAIGNDVFVGYASPTSARRLALLAKYIGSASEPLTNEFKQRVGVVLLQRVERLAAFAATVKADRASERFELRGFSAEPAADRATATDKFGRRGCACLLLRRLRDRCQRQHCAAPEPGRIECARKSEQLAGKLALGLGSRCVGDLLAEFEIIHRPHWIELGQARIPARIGSGRCSRGCWCRTPR